MRPEHTYKCRVRPCQQVKGASNHWFVAVIDADNRLIIEKFNKPERFKHAARKHGALEICSEKCLHIHMSRWATSRISASDAPACGSPAFMTGTTLTAWVSTVYRDGEALTGAQKGNPFLVVSYRDEGREQRMWCFNQDAYQRVEAAAGAHVKFRIQRRKNYAVIVDVLEILDGPQSVKGAEKDVNTAATASV